MIFDMKIEHNCASFYDEETKILIVVDSFDNKLFEVRAGTLTCTDELGSFNADSTEELNLKLQEIYKNYEINKKNVL